MHHGRAVADGLSELLASLDLDQLDPRRPQLMIEWVAMRFLNNDFRFHSREIRKLTNQGFIVSGKDACQSRLHRRRGAGSHQRSITVREFQHLCYALASGHFQVRDAYEVAAGHRHDGFEFGAKNRAAQHGHGAFAVDYGRDS